MTAERVAAALITQFEGFRATAYKDSGGIWTIGLGRTDGVKQGDTCTYDQAVPWMREDCAPLLKLVEHLPLVEAAALISFGYNCGIGRLKEVLGGKIRVTPDGFEKDGQPFGRVDRQGTVQQGLVARRRVEATLILASRLDSGERK